LESGSRWFKQIYAHCSKVEANAWEMNLDDSSANCKKKNESEMVRAIFAKEPSTPQLL
jgi:hypothetical protein